VTHQSSTRLRIRIPSQRGNSAFFEKLKEDFSGFPGLQGVETNPRTGSVLFLGSFEPEAIEQMAYSRELYRVKGCEDRPHGLPNRTVEPVTELNHGIRRMTGGRLDLSGFLFFTLLGTAGYQILRGNFGAPPWYTAFWYAFGVYTKQLIDAKQDEDAVE
jgi:hypothetical protein